MTLARFSPPAPPLSGHVPRRRRFAPVRQLLKFLRIFPVISYIFINILSYKNLYPIPLRILYLHIMFVFDIFAFNIFAFDIFSFDIFPFDIFPFDIFPFNIFPFNIFPFDIFPFDIFPFDIFSFDIFPFNIFPFDIFPFDIFPFNIFPFDIFTIQIHFYNIPKNPQMCPAHRDLPTPTHPHSRLNLPHPIPSHTYNGLKTISLPTTPSGRSPPSAQPSVSNTAAYRHKSTKLPPSTTKHSKKSPRGVQRGRGFAAPLRFSYFRKKILRPFANPNETQYFSKVFFYILLLNNTYSVHSLDLLEFI